MRITATALKTWSGILALLWTTTSVAGLAGTAGHATPAGKATVAATVMPSIEILPSQIHLAGTCGGAPFDVNTFINIGTEGSANVRLSAPVVGLLEAFTDPTGHIGPYNAIFPNFGVLGFGGGLAPNTPLTLTITTYSGNDLSGTVTYVSNLVFNCTTGMIINLEPGSAVAPSSIPTLSDVALFATGSMLVLLGMFSLRRHGMSSYTARSRSRPNYCRFPK